MRALIIGIGGQDGSYLADTLLERGYDVCGIHRRTSTGNLKRIEHIKDRVRLYKGDLCDTQSILNTISVVMPKEVYNLADQDDVGWSYETPGYTYEVTGAAVGRLLEGLSLMTHVPHFFQAISATIFGRASAPQCEETPLDPLSPYACAKSFALHLCRYYREMHGLYVNTAIFYNHDSPRRGGNYLLTKICKRAAEIRRGESDVMRIDGDLSQRVDIGYAGSYMEAVSDMMELGESTDLIIGSGRTYTIHRLVKIAVGEGVEIINNPYKHSSPDRVFLHGSNRKAGELIRWDGGKELEELIPTMVDYYANRDSNDRGWI